MVLELLLIAEVNEPYSKKISSTDGVLKKY